jgi:hypothetical protein
MLTYTLHHGRSTRPVLRLVPDESGLYRIEWPDIGLSDLANLTRCKQAAMEWAQRELLTEPSKLSVAQRLKSLKNFSWSASPIDLSQPIHVREPNAIDLSQQTPLETTA